MTLTEALASLGYSHEAPSGDRRGGRDIYFEDVLVATSMTCGAAWEFLRSDPRWKEPKAEPVVLGDNRKS